MHVWSRANPSWTAAASAAWLFDSSSPKLGLTFGVENHGTIRCCMFRMLCSCPRERIVLHGSTRDCFVYRGAILLFRLCRALVTCRYERSKDRTQRGSSVVQRHVAMQEEVDIAKGKGRLVRCSEASVTCYTTKHLQSDATPQRQAR